MIRIKIVGFVEMGMAGLIASVPAMSRAYFNFSVRDCSAGIRENPDVARLRRVSTPKQSVLTSTISLDTSSVVTCKSVTRNTYFAH